jgi:predicted small secreted protein
MTGKKVLAGIAVLALLLASCNVEGVGRGPKRVGYDLRGTWECMEAAFWPGDHTWKKGTIVLDYDTITITGPVAHLRDFTRGIALEAHTEEAEDGETGLLSIKDRGLWQSPVSYRRWLSGGTPKDAMLTLTGGGAADETLKKTGE